MRGRWARGRGKAIGPTQEEPLGGLCTLHPSTVLSACSTLDASPATPLAQVQDVVRELGEALGVPLHLPAFLRLKVGEGVDRDDKDFAAEVAATLAEAGKA